MNDKELLEKRFVELSHRAYEKGYTTYSNFLNMEEQSILSNTKCDCKYKLFGGYDNAERVIAEFSNYDDYDLSEIICIKISPVQQKFADKLSHRDFLGALMNLGIEREMLGDIVIKDNIGYLFCLDKISEYILSELSRIKHTTVKCEKINDIPQFLNTLPEEIEYIVSSIRIDTVISAIFKISRNLATQLVNQEKVFINSKIIYKDSVLLKENDIVSVRGYGKFIFSGIVNETKKHKIVISVRLYK